MIERANLIKQINGLGGLKKPTIYTMTMFKKKPVVIEAITFDELVEFGKQQDQTASDGMPWSFEYKGHQITHENDECYLIPTLEGTHNMTPKDMLITGVQGEIYPCKIDIFEQTYDKAESTFLERLIEEEAELGKKIVGLNKGLNSDGFAEKVGAYQFDLLSLQHGAMITYRRVLIMRIEDLKKQA